MFKKTKVGDRVFDILLGWGVVDNIDLNLNLPLRVKFDVGLSNYTLEGKTSKQHIRPRLYWGVIKFEVPKKPFNLEKEFDKLKVKEFVYGEGNYTLYFNCEEKKWTECNIPYIQGFTLYFYEDDATEFIKLLNENNISMKQLRPLIVKKINELYGKGE